jgi:NAD+ kinase
MKIGLCPSGTKLEALGYVPTVAAYLQKHGIDVFIDKERSESCDLPVIENDTPIDIFITIGGDGSLLYFKQKYRSREEAFFTAVNVGRLGFLADVSVSQINEYLDDLISGNFVVEHRIMLEVTTPKGATYPIINDVVFHRGAIRNMILLKVQIDGDDFNLFQADGLIISTPTGSSAYSLASGGPLMHHKLHAIVMTPICPHTLTSRPFVLPAESIISVEPITPPAPIDVVVDGLHFFTISEKEITTITLSQSHFKLISYPKRTNFYSTVRTKLHWSGKSA